MHYSSFSDRVQNSVCVVGRERERGSCTRLLAWES